MRIFVFGDSIAHGLWDEPGGWVQRLRGQLDKQTMRHLEAPYPDIYNLSISGDTTAGVARRFEQEYKTRCLKHEPNVLVFAIGINDSLLLGGKRYSSPERYRRELEDIVSRAKRLSSRVLFVGLTPVDETLSKPWRYGDGRTEFHNERIWEFETAVRHVCTANGVTLVRVFESFQSEQQKRNLLQDGLHPNAEGHTLIAGLVEPELRKVITPSE